MKVSFSVKIIVFVLLPVIIGSCWYNLYISDEIPGFPTYNYKLEQMERMRKLYICLQLDCNFDEVMDCALKNSFNTINISESLNNSKVLTIRTDIQYDARNWVIHLVFEEGKLTGKYIRYADSRKWKPIDAPDDVYLTSTPFHQMFYGQSD